MIARIYGKYKDVCTYYTLRGQEDYYGNIIIETSLRGIMQNCLDLIEEETLLQTNDCRMVQHRSHFTVNHNPKYHLKLASQDILSTTWVVQRVITDNYHWIRIKVRKYHKKISSQNIKR